MSSTPGLDAYFTAQQIMEQTGMTAAELLTLPYDEYARLSGRKSPTQAAIEALDAQVPGRPRQAPQQPPAPTQEQEPAPEPQGIDIASMDMQTYAQLRDQLGIGQGAYGRGALDGTAGTAEWAVAARAKSGRTGLSNSNVQEAARPDTGKYLHANEPVQGRASFYRGN